MFPYYNVQLHEYINDQQEEDQVKSILKMDYDQIVQFNSDFNTERALNPKYEGSHKYRLDAKCGILRINQLKKAGKFGSSPGLFESLAAIAAGWWVGSTIVDKLMSND